MCAKYVDGELMVPVDEHTLNEIFKTLINNLDLQEVFHKQDFGQKNERIIFCIWDRDTTIDIVPDVAMILEERVRELFEYGQKNCVPPQIELMKMMAEGVYDVLNRYLSAVKDCFGLEVQSQIIKHLEKSGAKFKD